MAVTSIARDQFRVTVGVDTHKYSHTGHARTNWGVTWVDLGSIVAFGIEGTSSYGAGLTCYFGPKAAWSSRSFGPAGRLGTSAASQTQSMLRQQQPQSSRARLGAFPQPATRRSKCCERFGLPGALRPRHARRQSLP